MKYTIRETVSMVREITVEGESLKEVEENYQNGDYDEELNSYYFDGQYDDVSYTIESEDGRYSVRDKERE